MTDYHALMKRCQIGYGGPNALADAHECLADCYGALGRLQQMVEFYKSRVDLLQIEQRWMDEPTRTLVCDIVANGQLLPDPSGERYGKRRIDR